MASLAHDPVVILAARGAFALLFASAAWHKLRDRAAFAAVLAAYRVLPAGVVAVAGVGVAMVELATAAAWLAPGTTVYAARATVALLAAYAVAIGVNLARGRRSIDCGCGIGGAAQPIGEGLVARNLLLGLAAWLTGLGAEAASAAVSGAGLLGSGMSPLGSTVGGTLLASRPLLWVDALTVAGVVAVVAAVWTAAHGLAAAAARVRVVDERHEQRHGADA